MIFWTLPYYFNSTQLLAGDQTNTTFNDDCFSKKRYDIQFRRDKFEKY